MGIPQRFGYLVGAAVFTAEMFLVTTASYGVPTATITSRTTTVTSFAAGHLDTLNGINTDLNGTFAISEQIDSIITDPAYGIIFSGKSNVMEGSTLRVDATSNAHGRFDHHSAFPPMPPFSAGLTTTTDVMFSLSEPAEVLVSVELHPHVYIQNPEFSDAPSASTQVVSHAVSAGFDGLVRRREMIFSSTESATTSGQPVDKNPDSDTDPKIDPILRFSWSVSLLPGSYTVTAASESFFENTDFTSHSFVLDSGGRIFEGDQPGADISLQFFDIGELFVGGIPPANVINGDFNSDGIVDDKDIDLLQANLGSNNEDVFDLDFDNDVDQDDLDILITDILGTFYGDANLDQFVGLEDLNTVLSNWNLNVTGWGNGDLNGDGFIGIADLNQVLGNWNLGSPPLASSVPEPASLSIVLGLSGLVCLRQRRR